MLNVYFKLNHSKH